MLLLAPPAVCSGSEALTLSASCKMQICGSSHSCSWIPALPLHEELELCCDIWRQARDACVWPCSMLGPGLGTRALWGSV